MLKWVFLFLLSAIVFLTEAQIIYVKDISDKPILVQQLYKGKATAIFFLSLDCPLCQGYSLTMRNLYNQFNQQGIEMIGIILGTDYDNIEIVEFKNKYTIPFKLYKDEKFELSSKYNATITPEVCVVNAKGIVLYQGRIDNWAYELGKTRKVVTEFDLKNALQSIVDGTAIQVSKTKAIGCFIEK